MSHYERSLELAERGRGKTGDHPVVGAVVTVAAELAALAGELRPEQSADPPPG